MRWSGVKQCQRLGELNHFAQCQYGFEQQYERQLYCRFFVTSDGDGH